MYCLYRLQYKSKRFHVPKCTHFSDYWLRTSAAIHVYDARARRKRYRMCISVYILWYMHLLLVICVLRVWSRLMILYKRKKTCQENLRCNVGPKITKKSRRRESSAPHFLTGFLSRKHMSRLSAQNTRLS